MAADPTLSIEIVTRHDPTYGENLRPDGVPTHAVPAGAVFGAAHRGAPGGAGFVLVSCAVSPGFSFDEWRLEGAAALRARFPGADAAAAMAELARAP